MDFGFSALLALLLLAAVASPAAGETTDAELQGHQLAQKLLNQRPTENYTNRGVLHIRGARDRRADIPLRLEMTVTATNWTMAYAAALSPDRMASLYIVHATGRPDEYYYRTNPLAPIPGLPAYALYDSRLAGPELMTAFAGSDFWIADLGQEFLHWPRQKLLRKEVKRSRGCSVLESTDPHPAANGYARVLSWIDTENEGLVQAFAYDANDQLLKEFYPKDLKKINGQWQVGLMEMDNDQTDSKTKLEFNLDPNLSPKE